MTPEQRYDYWVPQGEACAVCGVVREGPNQEYLGWWWHTACRATTDPGGRSKRFPENPREDTTMNDQPVWKSTVPTEELDTLRRTLTSARDELEAARATIVELRAANERNVAQATETCNELAKQANDMQVAVEDLRAELRQMRRDRDRFKEEVREAVKKARAKHNLCRDDTNEFLKSLGLPPLANTYRVKVTDDNTDETLLTVTGVEAADEEAACNHVRDNLTVSATVTTVKFNLGYDGDGDSDWTDGNPTWTELEDDADGYEDTFRQQITITATEE